jgi:hypothetical protein
MSASASVLTAPWQSGANAAAATSADLISVHANHGLGGDYAEMLAVERVNSAVNIGSIADLTDGQLSELGLPVGAGVDIKLFGAQPPLRPDMPASSKQASPNKHSGGRSLQAADGAVVEWSKRGGGKRFACFLSHHKASCAMEARFLKDRLQGLIQKECFLDSDDPRDLRELLDSVRDSDVLVIVQSAEVLTRPWCLLEMVAAVDVGVPIIAISVSGKGYNFAEATNLLTHLDTLLETINPGACALLRQNGVEPIDAAFKLSTALPSVIGLPFDSAASGSTIQASLLAIVAAMNTAKPMPQTTDLQECMWMQSRSAGAAKQDSETATHGTAHGHCTAAAAAPAPVATIAPAPVSGPAPIPPTVPERPDVMAKRPELLAEMRCVLLLLGAGGSAGVSVHGQGGVGKTTMASAVVRDSAVRNAFTRIAWVSVGQTPAVMELQCVLFNQLTGSVMPVMEGGSAGTQLRSLQAACIGQRWLVVLDDVWEMEHEKQLSCVDAASASKLLVTTRIRYILYFDVPSLSVDLYYSVACCSGLLTGCSEVSVNVLGPGEAVDLLLRTGEVSDVDEAASEAAAEIAELCGNLPLYLTICGGIILAYEGDVVWQTELIVMLLADRVGVIDDGSGSVKRLLGNSLSMIKDESISLAFLSLGVCPEDMLVVLPVAQLICGAEPQLTGNLDAVVMRRSIKELVDRHLLQGSAASGVQMHDTVRDLVQSRLGSETGSIRTKQRDVVRAFAAACPAGGWAVGGTMGHHTALALDDAVGQYAALALEILYGILCLAAAAFLRLGQDDDAEEAARILVSPKHHCTLPIDLAHGHNVLGQVAAKRDDLEAAGAHFGRAIEAAEASRFPLVEVLTARDWARAVGASAVAAADVAIDAACVKMGKSREQLASVLL